MRDDVAQLPEKPHPGLECLETRKGRLSRKKERIPGGCTIRLSNRAPSLTTHHS